jgi:hypothetical protein
MRDDWRLLVRSHVAVLMVLIGRMRVVEGRTVCHAPLRSTSSTIAYSTGWVLERSTTICTSRANSRRRVRSLVMAPMIPSQPATADPSLSRPCIRAYTINVSKGPVDHLDLPLVRRIIRVALRRRQVPVAHPLLQRAHRHPCRRHCGSEGVRRLSGTTEDARRTRPYRSPSPGGAASTKKPTISSGFLRWAILGSNQ